MWLSWLDTCHEGVVKLLARVAVTNEGSTGDMGFTSKVTYMVCGSLSSSTDRHLHRVPLAWPLASPGMNNSSESL